MAPTSAMLQGLNIVQDSPQPLSDPNDLASEPLSHDLAAHLDLWSSVHFASDEPLPSIHDRDSLDSLDAAYDAKSHSKRQQSSGSIIDPAQSPSSSSFFNYDSFLPGFTTAGSDAFPSAFGNVYYQHGAASPSAGHDGSSIVDSSLDPSRFSHHHGPTLSSLNSFGDHAHLAGPIVRSGSAAEITAPAAKKARMNANGAAASRAKSARAESVVSPSAAGDDDNSDNEDESTDMKRDISTPVTAAEDKRRRNTAASARFRMKKKEREQAMEKRAKDLEGRVGELERECEALRRENGWLKGLVVGVTGSVPGPESGAPGVGTKDGSLAYFGTSTTIAAGTKRDRDESS